jgi:hypothetical protein
MLAGSVKLGQEAAVLIDEVKAADTATIIVSRNRSGRFDIQTTFSPDNGGFLASAKGNITVNNTDGDFFEWIAADSTIPLIHPVRPVFSLGSGGPTPVGKIFEAIKAALGRTPKIDEINLQYHITGPLFDRFEFQVKAAGLSPSVEFRALSIEEFLNLPPNIGAGPIHEERLKGFTLDNVEKITLPSPRKYEAGA